VHCEAKVTIYDCRLVTLNFNLHYCFTAKFINALCLHEYLRINAFICEYNYITLTNQFYSYKQISRVSLFCMCFLIATEL